MNTRARTIATALLQAVFLCAVGFLFVTVAFLADFFVNL